MANHYFRTVSRVRHRQGRAEIYPDGFFLTVDIIDTVLYHVPGEEEEDMGLPWHNGPRDWEVRADGPFALDDSRLRRHLEGLTKLFLTSNNLSTLPEGIETLTSLRHLNVASNNLEDLPGSLVNLRHLEWVDVMNNNLSEVPQVLMEMTSLIYVNLSNNQLTPNITFPKHSWRYLEQLDLSENYSIKRIPLSIMNLRSLKSLWFHGCLLEEIPWTIGRLENLTTFSLGNNRLSQVPESIKGCTQLQRLHLENNRLRTLPKEIFELKYLEMLQIAQNKIVELPEDIRNLTSLKHLDVDHNRLTKLPRGLEECPSLKYLFVEHNMIKHFSFPLAFNWDLRMSVKGNPCKELSPDSNRQVISPLGLQAQAAGSIVNAMGQITEGAVPPGLRLALANTQICDALFCRRLTSSRHWHRVVFDNVLCRATRNPRRRVNLEALVCSNRCAWGCRTVIDFMAGIPDQV